ncbi:MAG: purine-nucleoside phosphorylase [Myxococcota bacterium]
MGDERGRVEAVAAAMASAFGSAPEAFITLGSGLGPVVDRATVLKRVPTTELGLPASTVVGHAGQAVLAELSGTRVLFLSGRVHRYEGYSMHEVVRYVRAAWKWGAKRLILSCSAGSLVPELDPGTVTLLSDHLNLMGDNPLIGGPLFESEATFPDSAQAHDPLICADLLRAAKTADVALPRGIYAALSGPAYESEAECNMLRIMGANLVGMSTVPELLAAKALDLPSAAFAVVSNYGAGVGEGSVDHASVTAVAGRAASTLSAVLERAAGAWGS